MREYKLEKTTSTISVAGVTPIWIREHKGQFEARVGVALMGSTNMNDKQFEACNHNPFHENFYDNYASGLGENEGEAIEAMKRDHRSIADSLWAF